MFVTIPDLKLVFSDFALLALVLAVMYAVTVAEAVTVTGLAATGVPQENRKQAATWAFAGVFLTLIAGVVAVAEGGSNGSAFLVVPFTFIAHWAYFHWRTSKLIDVQVILNHFEEAYREAVIEALGGKKGGLTIEQIREIAIDSNTYARMLVVGGPLVKAVLPMPIKDIVSSFMPTRAKTMDVLVQLQKDQIVVEKNEIFYLRETGQ